MPRATNGPADRRRRNKIFKAAKGYIGRRGTLIKAATETVEKGLARAFKDRQRKKREYRRLLDCAHQRRRPRTRHQLLAIYGRAEGARDST